MTEPEQTPTPAAGNAKKADRRKQTIIAGASIGGLFLTYLLFKKNSTTSTSGGGVAGSTDTSEQDALASNTEALGSVGNALNTLTGTLSGTTTVGGTTAPTAPTNSLYTQFVGVLNHGKAIVTNDSNHKETTQAQGASQALSIFNTDLANGKTIDQALAHVKLEGANYTSHKDTGQAAGVAQELAILTPLHATQGASKEPTAS